MLRKFKCFESGTNIGFRYSRVDVLGVRDIGGAGSGEIETVGIEVKLGAGTFATASGQALAYKIYANRVYLAQARPKPFDHREIEMANHLGIGLIHRVKSRIREVVSAPHHDSLPGITIEVLDQLRLSIPLGHGQNSLFWHLPSLILSSGHFYLAQTGHSHLAPTAARASLKRFPLPGRICDGTVTTGLALSTRYSSVSGCALEKQGSFVEEVCSTAVIG